MNELNVPNTSFPPTVTGSRTDADGWAARLDLVFAQINNQSKLISNSHSGPLRVQKTFTESDNACHVYLLHPPGGLVGGDKLEIEIEAGPGTSVLATTPSAGKFYRSARKSLTQSQETRIGVESRAHLEWLPQETIFFEGCEARMKTHVNILTDATFCGWEINCLGRPAAGESFTNGRIEQSWHVSLDGELVHRERWCVNGEETAFQQAGWGLRDTTIAGTFVAVSSLITSGYARGNADLRADVGAQGLRDFVHDPNWGLTMKKGVMLVRYLGDSATECRNGFMQVKDWLSASGLIGGGAGRQAPRIWCT